MPAGAGGKTRFAARSSPQNRALVKPKAVAFGDGGVLSWVCRSFRAGFQPERRAMFIEQLRRAVEASPRAELPAQMAHPLLPLPRPVSRRSRSNRRAFTPPPPGGP